MNVPPLIQPLAQIGVTDRAFSWAGSCVLSRRIPRVDLHSSIPPFPAKRLSMTTANVRRASQPARPQQPFVVSWILQAQLSFAYEEDSGCLLNRLESGS
jgi:hypothetical protein